MTAAAATGTIKTAAQAARPARTEDAIWYKSRVFKWIIVGFAAWVIIGLALAFIIR